MKRANQDEKSAELVEGRGPTKGNTGETAAPRTQSRKGASIGLTSVRQAARRDKKMRFTALLYHMTPELLKQSSYALKRKAAAGVDGVTWSQYGQDLWDQVVDPHARVHGGTYRAQPSKRTYPRKEDGKLPPLGLTALEDKIVQQADATVLEPI